MSNQEYDIRDRSGKTNVRGTIHPQPGGGIPQGGPLTQDLLTNSASLIGGNDGSVTNAIVQVNQGGGNQGGSVDIVGGQSGGFDGGHVFLEGATVAADGKVGVHTGPSWGAAGQALVSDGSQRLIYGGVQIAAAVPMGAPTGLPLAFDSTAVTGGLYVWNGAAWVKVSTIP
jgi:hypothetical protein